MAIVDISDNQGVEIGFFVVCDKVLPFVPKMVIDERKDFILTDLAYIYPSLADTTLLDKDLYLEILFYFY